MVAGWSADGQRSDDWTTVGLTLVGPMMGLRTTVVRRRTFLMQDDRRMGVLMVAV